MMTTIHELVQQYPCLVPYLEKVCRRYDRHGELSGVLKLGDRLADGTLTAFKAFFGLRALSFSGNGEVRLTWSRFFAGRSTEEVEAWVHALYQALDRPRDDRRLKARLHMQAATLLADRLRLAFPELRGIHAYLQENLATLARQIDRQGEVVAERAFQAAEIIRFLLQNQTPLTFSELGARFVNTSKALRDTELSRLIAAWLQIQEESEDAPWPWATDTIWGRYHVVRDRLAVQATVFGPLLYEKDGQTHDWIFRLWQMGEPATLSWANINGMARIWPAPGHEAEGAELTTIENEAPFARLIRERHPGPVLYTAGFPNDAVLALYRLFATSKGRHWGDSDLAGLRIAAILHAIHPLGLWRCELSTLERHERQLIPLRDNQAEQIAAFISRHPEFPFMAELEFTLANGWLEQESWQG
jgi:hypothetical protein